MGEGEEEAGGWKSRNQVIFSSLPSFLHFYASPSVDPIEREKRGVKGKGNGKAYPSVERRQLRKKVAVVWRGGCIKRGTAVSEDVGRYRIRTGNHGNLASCGSGGPHDPVRPSEQGT